MRSCRSGAGDHKKRGLKSSPAANIHPAGPAGHQLHSHQTPREGLQGSSAADAAGEPRPHMPGWTSCSRGARTTQRPTQTDTRHPCLVCCPALPPTVCQQHMTAQPVMGMPGYGPGAYPGGVQMVPMGGAPHSHPQQGCGAPAGYPPQGAAPGGAYPAQPQQPPAGYPTQQFAAPAGTAAAPQNTGV
jgi:hypothetical protein